MKKRRIMFVGVSICLLILLSIGVSYSYWKFTYVAIEENDITSTCFSMSITDEENPIVLESAYPITDEDGMKLTPYSFTITNTCDINSTYLVTLESLGTSTTLSNDYVAVWIKKQDETSSLVRTVTEYREDSNYGISTTSIEGNDTGTSTIIAKGELATGLSVTYTLGLWIDEDVTLNDDAQNKNYEAKIVIIGSASKTINDVITLNNITVDYTGEAVTPSATSLSNTDITYKYYSTTDCSGTALDSIPVDAGTYSILATSVGNEYYNSSSTCSTLTINKIPITGNELSITIETTSTPPNITCYNFNENVDLQIIVAGIEETAYDIQIVVPVTGDIWSYVELPIGEARIVTTSHTITGEEYYYTESRTLEITVTANVGYFKNHLGGSYSAKIEIPLCDLDDVDEGDDGAGGVV